MTEKEKNEQAKIIKYPPGNMGILLIPHKMISLHESFIQEVLRKGKRLEETNPVFREEEIMTQVGCPFCERGVLKLESIKEILSPESKLAPIGTHIGNHYKYGCSNPDCEAKFIGDYTWF